MSQKPKRPIVPITRRAFLTGAAAVAGGLAASASHAAGPRSARRRKPPEQKVRLVVVGAGGRGADDLNDLRDTGVEVVALCDCDHERAAETFKAYPAARQYTDWRRMFEAERAFDAVLVATPDHNHAVVSIAAMKLGKHVYCEKPLAHSIWEARQMAKVAAEKGVATQMG